MSLFLAKSQGANQPWAWTWTPGSSLANFFSLYSSLGDQTISGPTSIPTTLDGPIQVARYGNLTVNAALTPSHRCRGLIVLADSLAMGASGSISMTGMGAAGSPKWAVSKDIFVPASITFTGENTSLAQFLAWIKSTGYCIFDPSLYASPPPGMGDVQCDWATWTPYGGTIISAAGCGVGGAGVAAAVGAGGAAGTSAPGGGGSGANYNAAASSPGGNGTPWGGGAASAATNAALPAANLCDQHGGKGGTGTASASCSLGGGAGNPGGAGANSGATGSTGTGGVLLVIVRGNVNLTAGHAFSANGAAGGGGTGMTYNLGGGGSGGGKCGVYYSGSLTGTFNQTATGGAAGTGSTYAGGAGGSGHAENKTFAVMGW